MTRGVKVKGDCQWLLESPAWCDLENPEVATATQKSGSGIAVNCHSCLAAKRQGIGRRKTHIY